MVNAFPKVLKGALQLSPIERAKLLEQIYRSFKSDRENEINKAWAREAESRINAYERGEIEGISYEQVKRSIGRE